MAENFYTILTNVGKAKIANAQALGATVNLTLMAVGDGNGAYYNPVETQAALASEVWRGAISSIDVDAENPNWIVVEAVIPTADGGFMVREVGLFDDAGGMIAVGKYPETYKPVLGEGSAKDLYIRMIIEVSNASVVTLKIDPAVVLATKKNVDDAKTQANTYTDTKVSGLAGAGRITETVKGNATALAAHLADYAQQAHLAKNIGLEDIADNFTSNNLEGAMNELFTNVSDGKALVGGAITDVDPNVVIPTDPTFQQLASSIGEINVGFNLTLPTGVLEYTRVDCITGVDKTNQYWWRNMYSNYIYRLDGTLVRSLTTGDSPYRLGCCKNGYVKMNGLNSGVAYVEFYDLNDTLLFSFKTSGDYQIKNESKVVFNDDVVAVQNAMYVNKHYAVYSHNGTLLVQDQTNQSDPQHNTVFLNSKDEIYFADISNRKKYNPSGNTVDSIFPMGRAFFDISIL